VSAVAPLTSVGMRLALARACAWSLLLAGWVGIGSLALALAPSDTQAYAAVALWLLALGAAAAIATRGGLRPLARGFALVVATAVTAGGLWASLRGGGMPALWLAVLGWAVLTALASGVVRSLRLALAVAPAPPIVSAASGALVAALVLSDLADPVALASRLAGFVIVTAALLLILQRAAIPPSPASGCRAGLFDCSLPAWPTGAGRGLQSWPMLLAGLAMLPMMASLPLISAWCRAEAVPAQGVVLLHLGAMFGPVLLLRHEVVAWSPRRLAASCAVALAAGAIVVLAAPAPYALLGLAFAHGAAWGLAWAGQLWAPARRGQQGSSPLRAGAGYASLTLVLGVVVTHFGAVGVTAIHVVLAAVAVIAWLAALIAHARAGKRGDKHRARDGLSRPQAR